MHSPALNNDKDPYKLSVTSEPSVPPPRCLTIGKIAANFYELEIHSTPHSHTYLHLATFREPWSPMAWYDPVRSCTAPYGLLWSFILLYGPVWSGMVPLGPKRSQTVPNNPK